MGRWIVESIILNQLEMSNRIFARKCKLVELDKKTAKKFFTDNHLMGKGQGTAFALMYCGEIVCGMQIINRANYIDISRFSTKITTSVVGGFSKLLKHIENTYNKDIHTFVDLRYGSGNYLVNLGFEKVHERLSFVWTKDGQTFHRMKFPGNSGYKNRCAKLWDCGQAKFVKQIKNKS